MAVKLKSRTKALFERAFPERQIYHRSGGSVRYVSISPWRQAMMAGAATLVVGWCLFATGSVLLRGPAVDGRSVGSDRKLARYERELQQARAQEAFALSLLEERTADFEKNIADFENRMTTLKSLMASLQGKEAVNARSLTGEGATVLVDSSIEEADARQARQDESLAATGAAAGFRARFDRLKSEQVGVLDAAEDEAVARAERLRGVVMLTGVPVTRLLNENPMGGPLIPISQTNQGDEFARRATEVAARLNEAKAFEDLIHTVPLGTPVDTPYRETSGYGERRDPFNHRLAWHDGVDLAAFNRAPIVATAPGKVVYAGWKQGYGNAVEVDHGSGFRTLYGHMSSVAVKVGTSVAIGQKLGTMGSTGRSTGPHLHYEVYFHGKTYDPIRFLRAGKHVHEG